MTSPRYLRAAETHLAARDPVLARLIASVGRCTLRRENDPFLALVGTVISQQISTKAARAIRARVHTHFKKTGVTPKAIARAADEALRSCGLSGPKQRTMRALAARVLSGELDLKRLQRQPIEAVAEALLPIPGIGPWSVHMFLMFGLARPDVLPVGDYGLRVAVRNEYKLTVLPAPAAIEEIAASWRPYCTVASWYMWRSLGPAPGS